MNQKISGTNKNSNLFLNGDDYTKDVVECQADLICRFNKDYNLTFANGAFYDYFQALLSSLDRDNPIATAENSVSLPNGDKLWRQWVLRAIFNDKGLLVEYQTVGRDITERKLIEKRLRESKKDYEKLIESENNFRTLAEYANDGIVLIGAEGKFIYANRALAEISGYNLDELLTFSFEKLADPSEREILGDRLRRRLKGENVPNQYETHLINKAGRAVPIEVSATKTIWQGDPAGLIIVRDITERRQMETSLQISENNFRTLAENAQDGILLVAGEGLNVYANKKFAQLSGYTVSELCKIGIKELVPANEFKKITERYFNRIAGKKVPDRYEANLVRKDGKIVPIEVSASKTAWHNQTVVLGIYRDISERIKSEEEQTKVRDELERLVDEKTSELKVAAEEMELKHNELLLRRSQLEKANLELLDTNRALTTLARNIDQDMEDAEKNIAKIVRSRMLPHLENFQQNASFKKYRAEIDGLILSLHELAPGLTKGSDIILSLSATERRIAAMIKNGLTSTNIANVMHISLDTVKSHRRNIRKKLKLNNTRINLAAYLAANT